MPVIDNEGSPSASPRQNTRPCPPTGGFLDRTCWCVVMAGVRAAHQVVLRHGQAAGATSNTPRGILLRWHLHGQAACRGMQCDWAGGGWYNNDKGRAGLFELLNVWVLVSPQHYSLESFKKD